MLNERASLDDTFTSRHKYKLWLYARRIRGYHHGHLHCELLDLAVPQNASPTDMYQASSSFERA